MSDDKSTRPRFGDEIDTDTLADWLEAYAAKLRERKGYLQGVNVSHEAQHDEWARVEVTIRTVAHPDIPLLDHPMYEERDSDGA